MDPSLPRLIVGLGNPGPEYATTRHNIGANLLYYFGELRGSSRWRSRFKGHYSEAKLDKEPLSLLFPHTFMNLSGESVARALDKLHLPVENLIVLHDDVDLPFGKVKIKVGGGAGGHNGLKSLMAHLPDPGFVRLRLGIGRPQKDMISWVLGPFSPEEEAALPGYYEKSTQALEAILRKGATYAMNGFNGA